MARGRLITIGTFDGVHVGHQAVLDRTAEEGKKRGMTTLALTFETPPKMILSKKNPLRLITGPEEKGLLIRDRGIDRVEFLRFDRAMSRIRPFAFFRSILLERFNAGGLVIGFDFRFGVDRSAGARELVRWGEEFEIPVWVVGPVKRRGTIVSSTRIRNDLQANRFASVLRRLGHPYLLAGTVKRARGVGAKIGFPTANLRIHPGVLTPPGVFAARLRAGRRSFNAVCNIGVRPTFRLKKKTEVEVHVYGQSVQLAEKHVVVELHKRLRGEKKFRSVSALQAQIRRDICRAIQIVKSTQNKTLQGSGKSL